MFYYAQRRNVLFIRINHPLIYGSVL